MIIITPGWVGGSTTGILWVEARDAFKHPPMHRTPLKIDNLIQNVNSAEVEKPTVELQEENWAAYISNYSLEKFAQNSFRC